MQLVPTANHFCIFLPLCLKRFSLYLRPFNLFEDYQHLPVHCVRLYASSLLTLCFLATRPGACGG